MEDRTASVRDDEATGLTSTARGFSIEQVRTAVQGIRYGEVRVIIQDGVIVQIERVEKQRIR